MYVTDVERFINEISEQKYIMNITQKLKILEDKDLVGKRINEIEVIGQQSEYFKSFRPYNFGYKHPGDYEDDIDFDDVNSIEDKEIANKVRVLIQENENRRKQLIKEGRALIVGDFNRII